MQEDQPARSLANTTGAAGPRDAIAATVGHTDDRRVHGRDAAIYRLLSVPGLRPEAVRRVLSSWRADESLIEEFWHCSAAEFRSRWCIGPRAARLLHEWDEDAEARCMVMVRTARDADVETVSVLDANFADLCAVRLLPPVLFARGNQDHLWAAGIAIAHSRDAAEEALDWSAAVAAALGEAGIAMVTGHNRDGYRRVAAAAKRASVALTVVVDRPLHAVPARGPRAEPVATARLWDDCFRPERELVVSALPPSVPWAPSHLRVRDALILHMAEVIVIGDARPGGTMASLCAEAAARGTAVFRSPFCRSKLDAPLLPEAAPAAARVICDALATKRIGDTPAAPRPGWVERRWHSEIAHFVEALKVTVDGAGQVEWRVTVDGSEGAAVMSSQPPGPVLAAIRVPGFATCGPEELIVVRRIERGAGDGPALLLSPGAAVPDLAALRAYLERCHDRLRQTIKTRPR